MLSMNAVRARVARNTVPRSAQPYFVPEEDVVERIPLLKKFDDQQFLFAVKKSQNRWTALSVNFLYTFNDDKLNVLQIDTEGQKLWDYFGWNGVDFCEDVHFDDGRYFWMKSSGFAQLLLNLTSMLKKVPCGVKLED